MCIIWVLAWLLKGSWDLAYYLGHYAYFVITLVKVRIATYTY